MATPTSPTEQMMAENALAVILLRGTSPDDQPIFAYVGVRVDKLDAFMEAQKLGNFDPEEYGTIIEAGLGEPTDEIRKKMEEEYGFNHEKMVNLPTDMQ